MRAVETGSSVGSSYIDALAYAVSSCVTEPSWRRGVRHGAGPWGYNATHKVPQLTIEDNVNSRYTLNPLRLWDCDRPVNASAAYLFTTAERARDMRQPPVYVLNHSQHNFRQRT